jgi:hypothetical protein
MVRSIVVKYAEEGNRPIACTRCQSKNTGRIGKIIRSRPVDKKDGAWMDEPATEGQLSYIRGLGGNVNNVKTKREAGDYIGKLKKMQQAGNS